MIQRPETTVILIKLEKVMSCTCGRSPTGKCVGWHKLSEEEYKNKKLAWETNQKSAEDAA